MTTRDIKIRILERHKDSLTMSELSLLAADLDQLTNASRYEINTQARIVVDWAEVYRDTWQDKPESHWLAGIMEEVLELALSLEGKHEHTPELELKQIAAIAINWLRKRETESR